MTTPSFLRACALISFAAFALPASAHDFKVGSLKIDHPWTRATPGGAKVGGGFMKITNNGTETDRLIGGTAEIAKALEIHEMKMEGSTMKMRALEKGLEIKPGETVELKPGGFHVMFLDLQKPIKDGENLKGQLVFEKAGKVDVEYKVEARGAAGSSDHAGHGAHDAHGKKAP